MVSHYSSCNNANYTSGGANFQMAVCLSVKELWGKILFWNVSKWLCSPRGVGWAWAEPLVHTYGDPLWCSSCQSHREGPPGWLAGSLFFLQTRRGLTLYERAEKTTMRDLFGFIFSRAVFTVRRRLHDVPPQTFIRPPMMAAFHCVVLPRVDV